jgi:beta-lactamase class A
MDNRLTLEKRIEAELKSYDGRMGIYINDFCGNLITAHADEEFEAASTIKIFILAALFEEIEQGRKSLKDVLEYKPCHAVDGSGILEVLELGTTLSVMNLATLMIIVSDNIATNILIDYLGLDTINSCMEKLGCHNTRLHNPLHFERYRTLGTTTPRDYAHIFEELAQGTLISKDASEKMLNICKEQHYNSMLTKFIPPYFMDPDNYTEEVISFASKSGSMNACRNDGGLVSTPYGSYVIILFNKNFSDAMYYHEHPAIVFSARISRLVLDQYLALEGRLKM